MCVVDGRVIQINQDSISIQLILLIPYNRIGIEIQHRIPGVELHRIAYTLQIRPIETHAIVGLHLPIGGVNRYHQHRIRVEEKRIALAILQETGAIGRKSILCPLIIKSILPLQSHMLRRVLHTHVTKSLAKTSGSIISDGITRQNAITGNHLRPLQQRSPITHRIVPTFRGIDRATIRDNHRRAQDGRHLRVSIIIQGI